MFLPLVSIHTGFPLAGLMRQSVALASQENTAMHSERTSTSTLDVSTACSDLKVLACLLMKSAVFGLNVFEM